MQKKKIAILTHFASFQPSYALSVGWHERARLLEHFDQDFDFLVNVTCPEDLYPHQVNCLPRIKTSKPFKERAEYFRDAYLDLLEPYDAILTADIIYQTKGNHLAYNQAVRWASPELKAKWYHWIHSGWTDRPNPLPPYPYNLHYEYHEGSKVIYLNSFELGNVAKMYDTSIENIECVHNPKDPRTFFNLSPLATKIVNQLRLWTKDVVQIFPHCSTRMDSKGIEAIARIFGEMKRKGAAVAIIFANGNSRSVQEEIQGKKRIWRDLYDLHDGADYLFTSDYTEKLKPLPRQDVADLFRLSNLFVFGSWRETVGNAFQEAKISGNLLVLNENLPPMQEMGGKDAIFFHSDFKTPGRRDGLSGDLQACNYPEDYFDKLTRTIAYRLGGMPLYRERWRFSWEYIWENQFYPLLYETPYPGMEVRS